MGGASVQLSAPSYRHFATKIPEVATLSTVSAHRGRTSFERFESNWLDAASSPLVPARQTLDWLSSRSAQCRYNGIRLWGIYWGTASIALSPFACPPPVGATV